MPQDAPHPPAAAPPREILVELYRVATEAVDPGHALSAALRKPDSVPVRPPWIIALGKAAVPMAEAAVAELDRRGLMPAGGLIVAPVLGPSVHPSLAAHAGDHPEPGAGSFGAAVALGDVAARIGADDEVWLLLSGGTTSLIGAPEDGMSPADLTLLYSLLLGSGLDIAAMNRIRKRFSRWGGGKLARALAPARVRMFVVSDVIGDDPASIGSGPCVPDPSTASEVHRMLEAAALWDRLPAAARELVTASEAGERPETPKPGEDAFARVTLEIIASNRLGVDAAASRARALGLVPVVGSDPLAGEASIVGGALATQLLENRGHSTVPQPEVRSAARRCFIWGGETTVTLDHGSHGIGGRCQELALAAARVLDGSVGVTLLAAGTDGRDGPTDAAGAIVDGKTWRTIAEAGRDPAQALATHDAYPALDAAGALLRPGLTGTNVMDVVIAIG